AVQAEDAAVDVRLAQQHAGVVDQVAGREVVGAVDDDVVGPEDVQGVGAGEARLVEIDLDLGVDGAAVVAGRVQVWTAVVGGAGEVGGAVEHLALQVGEVHHVKIDQPEPADARGGEVQRQGRAEAAGADQQDAAGLEALLALEPDLGHDQVAAVPGHLVPRQL